MIEMLFDQYQRYKMTEDIINDIRNKDEVFKILEVGANEHQNLERFLPSDEITYLDIKLPEHLLNNPNYILGDATKMSFADSQYDIIVALDIFEHIAESDRTNFIDELYRVCKKVFIIAAPFATKGVVETEKNANEYFRLLHGYDHLWLEEHIRNTLPDLKDYLNYMDRNQIEYRHFSHGTLEMWYKLIKIHFTTTLKGELLDQGREIDKFYNKNLYPLDTGVECYRQFIVGYKEKETNIKGIIETEEKWDISSYCKFLDLETQFQSDFINILTNKNNDKDDLTNTHISNLEELLLAKDTHISNLEESVLAKDTHISNLEESVLAKDTHISNLEESVLAKDTHISNLEESVLAKDTHISNLEDTVLAKDNHISNLEGLVLPKDNHISNLEDIIKNNGQYIQDLEKRIMEHQTELDLIYSTLLGKLINRRMNNLRQRR